MASSLPTRPSLTSAPTLLSLRTAPAGERRVASDLLRLVPGLAQRLEDGAHLLEIGCGRAQALLDLAAAFPACRVTGYDTDEAAIAWTRAEAARRGLSNVRVAVADPCHLEVREAYDIVLALDAVQALSRPHAALAAAARALRPDGTFVMRDRRLPARRSLDARLAPEPPPDAAASAAGRSPLGWAAGNDAAGWRDGSALDLLDACGLLVVDLRVERADSPHAWWIARPTPASA